MFIYEVNLEVEPDVDFKVAGWLTEHIQKMLGFQGFKAAYWFFRKAEDEGREPTENTLWTIQYVVEDRSSIDDYAKNHADSVRQEAVEKFGDKIKVNRRTLALLSVAGLPFEQPPRSEH